MLMFLSLSFSLPSPHSKNVKCVKSGIRKKMEALLFKVSVACLWWTYMKRHRLGKQLTAAVAFSCLQPRCLWLQPVSADATALK